MRFIIVCALVGAACAVVIPNHEHTDPQKPVFPSSYVAEGFIMLPYAEIYEPFLAYYNGPANKSRIDYYSTMKTYLRADLGANGVSYKVAPLTNEKVLNQITCFQVNGTPDSPVSTQSILPDVSDFKFIANVPCHYTAGDCESWGLTQKMNNDKINRYTLIVSRNSDGSVTPRAYEMQGYDSLIGSHFDKYVVVYKSINSSISNEDVFNPPENLECNGFPGPGLQGHSMNPMSEFVHPHDRSHIDTAFELFKSHHNKTYSNQTEHETRKTHFTHNYHYIQSTNRRGLNFTVRVNNIADFSGDERKQMFGKLRPTEPNNGKPFDKDAENKDIPADLDWRLLGAVTPVKDQAICGSCWSFGTTGTIEGALFLKKGELHRLSQQNLMDCSWGFGNNACDGGEEWRAYEWIMKHGGIMTEHNYGPYLGADSNCHYDPSTAVAQIKSYVNVTSGDLGALKLAIANHGPIAVDIDASHKSLSFYDNGIYSDPDCRNDPDGLDHAVLAVGYGNLYGQDYWLVKNSWSTYWGNDGYVLFQQKDNMCGVATSATFVELE